MKTILFLTSSLALGLAQGATLAHRYSFDSDATDSVGGNDGTLQNGATVSGGNLVLAGTGVNTGGNHMGFTNPVDIGGNFGASGVTIESWYTDNNTGTWGKLFHFGNNAAGEEIGYTHTRGNGEQSGVDRGGSNLLGEQVTTGVSHHLALTISSDGNLNAWVDGVQKLTDIDTNDLSNVNTTFEGIGATNWNDPGMNGTVDEFRIWSGELSSAEVASSFAAGANTVVPEPSGLLLTLAGGLLVFRRRRS